MTRMTLHYFKNNAGRAKPPFQYFSFVGKSEEHGKLFTKRQFLLLFDKKIMSNKAITLKERSC